MQMFNARQWQILLLAGALALGGPELAGQAAAPGRAWVRPLPGQMPPPGVRVLQAWPQAGIALWQWADETPAGLRSTAVRNAVAWQEPDYEVSALGVPNDPGFPLQWPMLNTGQQGGPSGADIAAPQAWALQTGSPQVVCAVFDSGIDWQHPDLAENIWQNLGEDADGDGKVLEWNGSQWVFDPGDANGTDDDGNGYPDDFIGWDFVDQDNTPFDDHFAGHGTHVSGLIGARGNNGIGIAGVAWQAKLMPLKFLNSRGIGFVSGAVAAMQYALQQGAQLSNHSWGSPVYSQALLLAMQQADQAGHIMVAAAGNTYGNNNDRSPVYPASFPLPRMIAVAATDSRDSLARFSNTGVNSVDLAAPGAGLYSTLPGASYGYMSGTSMAAPLVSGAVCLAISQFSSAGPDFWIRRLLQGTDPLPGLAGRCATGGRLNLLRMLGGSPAYELRAGGPPSAFRAADLAAGPQGSYLLAENSGAGWISRLGSGDALQWQRSLTRPGGWSPAALAAHPAGGAVAAGAAPGALILAHTGQDGSLGWQLRLGLAGTWTGVQLGSAPDGSFFLAALGEGSAPVLYAARITLSGSLAWQQQWALPPGAWTLRGLAADDQHLWLCGSAGTSPMLVQAKPGSGAAWMRSYTLGAGAEAWGIAVDGDDEGLLLAGSIWAGADTNIFVLEIGEDGEALTRLQLEGLAFGRSLRLETDAYGQPVLAAALADGLALLPLPAGAGISEAVYASDGPGTCRPAGLAAAANGSWQIWSSANAAPGGYFIQSTELRRSPCDEGLLPVSAVAGLPPGSSWLPMAGAAGSASLLAGDLAAAPAALPETLLCSSASCSTDAYFTLPPPPLCEDDTFVLNNQSLNASSYEWRADGIPFSTVASPLYMVDDDPVILTLIASDGTCSSSFSLALDPEPDLLPVLTDTTVCGPAVLLDPRVSGVSYEWQDAGGQVLSVQRTYRATVSGLYTVTVTDACGESASASSNVVLQPGCMWPGDVNADGYVEITDYLLLGMAHGTAGPQRPGASSAYTSQPAPDWPQGFAPGHPLAPGVNYKHADCDGDGLVSALADGLVVRQNAGPLTSEAPAAGGPFTVTLVPEQASVNAGDSIAFEVRLDHPQTGLVEDAYGLAFQVNYNLPVQFSPDVETQSAWMNPAGGQASALTLAFPSRNRLDVGITRLNQTDISGNGRVARMCCVVVVIEDIGDYSAQSDAAVLSADVSKARMYRADGTEIQVNALAAQGSPGVVVRIPRLRTDIRMLLQGPYDAAAGRMRTQLRSQNLLPPQSPYPDAPLMETASMPEEVVDWVQAELRPAAQPDSVTARQAAWLTAAGRLLDPLTLEPLSWRAPSGNYRIALLHRNHLPVLTDAVQLQQDSMVLLNVSTMPLGGVQAEIAPGLYALRAGELNGDRRLQYSGPGNDRRYLLLRLGAAGPAGAVQGYWPEDLNLDGEVRYLGPGNDRELLLGQFPPDEPTAILHSNLP